MSLVATQLGAFTKASATPKAPKDFGTIRQINAGVLNVSYAEMGPENGKPVLLLHGWPYDIYSFADASNILAAKGYGVIVPYLRGYGTTRPSLRLRATLTVPRTLHRRLTGVNSAGRMPNTRSMAE
jgi:pimeloyl-ACP methyl ester carboxylesterase